MRMYQNWTQHYSFSIVEKDEVLFIFFYYFFFHFHYIYLTETSFTCQLNTIFLAVKKEVSH